MVTFKESICSIAGSSEQSASIIAISPGLLARAPARSLSPLSTGLLRMGTRQTPLKREMATCQHRGRALGYAGEQES